MNSPRHISAAEILQVSAHQPVTLQGEGMDVFDGIAFPNDEVAVAFHGEERQGKWSKIDIPLDLSMEATFKTAEAGSTNRPLDGFRLVLADREVAPHGHAGIRAVMPHVLHYGIASLVLDVREEDASVFRDDSFWFNVLEPDAPQPIQEHMPSVNLQVFINQSEIPTVELLVRYIALKERVGKILEGVINTSIATS